MCCSIYQIYCTKSNVTKIKSEVKSDAEMQTKVLLLFEKLYWMRCHCKERDVWRFHLANCLHRGDVAAVARNHIQHNENITILCWNGTSLPFIRYIQHFLFFLEETTQTPEKFKFQLFCNGFLKKEEIMYKYSMDMRKNIRTWAQHAMRMWQIQLFLLLLILNR